MNMIRAVVLLFLFVGKLTFFFVYCVGGEGWVGLLHILCVTVVPDEPCVVAPNFRGGGVPYFLGVYVQTRGTGANRWNINFKRRC